MNPTGEVSSMPNQTRFILVLASLLGFLATPAKAAENCECDHYGDFVAQYQLSTQISDIGVAAIHHEGRAFSVDSELAQAARLRIESDERIPKKCRTYLKSQVSPRPSILFHYLSARPDKELEVTAARPRQLISNYLFTYQSFNYHCPYPPQNATKERVAEYTACQKENAPKEWEEFSNIFNGSNSDQYMRYAFALGSGPDADRDLAIIKAYHHLVEASKGGKKAMLDHIRAGKLGLDPDEVLTLVQMLGKEFSEGYDYDRAEGKGANAKGAVTGDQLMDALRNNMMFRTPSGYLDGSLKKGAGVCRDMMSFQGEILKAAGFENTVVITYKTRKDAHLTLIAQDPRNPKRMHLLNYDQLLSREGVDGSVALYQGWGSSGFSDHSLDYRANEPSGGLLVTVPSEIGKFLHEAAGFDIHSLDPLARETSSMTATHIPIGDTGLSVRAFAGNDGVDNEYLGLASSFEWAKDSILPGKVGVVGSIFQSAEDSSGLEDPGMLGYVALEQHLKTPKLEITPEISATLDSALTVGAMLYTHPTFDEPTDYTHTEKLNFELGVEQKSEDGNFHANYRVGTFVRGGFNDSRGGDYVPKFTTLYAGASATLKVDDVVLIGDTMWVFDALGVRQKTELGIAYNDFSVSAQYSGRVTEDTMLVQDGTLHRAGATLVYSPSDLYQVSVTGEMTFEAQDGQDLDVMGNLEVFF